MALLLGGLTGVSRAQLCSPEPRPLVVLINSATRLQLSTRKPIKTVLNPKEGLLTIRTVESDPTVVLLVGSAPGVTRIELQDADGNREVREIIIQPDVEYLARQIKRAVPLSNVTVIPSGQSSVILTGFVQRAEDISVAQAVAQSVGFQVINGLRLNGVQQVQLDVVIARVQRNKGRSFGFNFLQNSQNVFSGSTVGGILPQLGTRTVGIPGTLIQPGGTGSNVLNAAPNTANLFAGIISGPGGFIAFLQALENEGLAKLLAQPRLVTLSGNPASFLDGGEQAIPVPAGLGQVGVQFEEFGTRLNFLPVVLGNGRIHLEVEPEVSTLDANAGVAIAGATVAGRATQRIHTTVEMESGQTYVIGGLIQKTTSGAANKVPLIGQVPFLGTFFSTKNMTETETELVVLVTPHLVDAQSACQVGKILPGQESRSPDDFELFLEGILEAPRGPRAVYQNGRYVPSHLNGPTADLFPCAGSTDGFRTHLGRKGRGNTGAAGCQVIGGAGYTQLQECGNGTLAAPQVTGTAAANGQAVALPPAPVVVSPTTEGASPLNAQPSKPTSSVQSGGQEASAEPTASEPPAVVPELPEAPGLPRGKNR